MTIAELQQLLTPELIEQFWDYCCDDDTISSYRVNIIAEIDFIDEVELDQIIATSTIESLMFLAESPLLEIEDAIKAGSPEAAWDCARWLHWHFLLRARADRGLGHLDAGPPMAWMSQSPRSYLPNHGPEYRPPSGKEPTNDLSDKQIDEIAKFVIREYPEEAAYIAAARLKADSLGYTGTRDVGWLKAPDGRIFQAKVHLFGFVKGAAWFGAHQVKSRICQIIGERL